MGSSETFLDDVDSALSRRRKAVSYHLRDLQVRRGVQDGSERLEIEAIPRWPRIMIRLIVWPDRWVWIDARRSGKNGWVWQFTADGRLAGGHSARTLIERMEETIGAASPIAEDNPETLANLWKPLLAQGPRKVG